MGYFSSRKVRIWHPKSVSILRSAKTIALQVCDVTNRAEQPHVAPKIWVLTRMCYRGGVVKCEIVTGVRMVESTGGDVSFFRNICGDKNSFYRQVFLHYIRTFDIKAVHVIFDSEKHVYKSLNFKTLSLTIAIVNGSRHESQHNKFTTGRAVGFMLYGARNEMECQGLGRTNLFFGISKKQKNFRQPYTRQTNGAMVKSG